MTDELMHYGKKGMRWGSRQEKNAAIQEARIRQEARVNQIVALDRQQAIAKTAKGKQAALKQIEKIGNDYFNSGDAKVAKMMTSGEKMAVTLLSVGAVGIIAGSVASALK